MKKYGKPGWKKTLAWLLVCGMLAPGLSGHVWAADIQDVQNESTDETLIEETQPEEMSENEDLEISETPEVPEDEENREKSGEVLQVTETPEVSEDEVPQETGGDELDNAEATSGWKTENGIITYTYENGTMARHGWHVIGKHHYYFNASGHLHTGWLTVGEDIYYLSTTGEAGVKGRMVTGWHDVDGKTFYFQSSEHHVGKLAVGWHDIEGHRYYFVSSGEAGVKGQIWRGWLKQNNHYYYFKQTGEHGVKGRLFTGWQNIGSKTYYFKASGSAKGVMFTGFQNVGNYRYYFKESGTYGEKGEVYTGWHTINNVVYHLSDATARGYKGRMSTGWHTIGKYKFYFMQSGTYKGKMLTGWQNVGKHRYFFKRGGAYGARGAMLVGRQSIDGMTYYFGKDGIFHSSHRTIRGLIQNAMVPMGHTLYIWGGGHDDWEGGNAVRIGENPSWKKFFDSQDSSYSYTRYRENPKGGYYYDYGFDCSGFVGWTVYNTLNTKSNGRSCTTGSGEFGDLYSGRGWGSVTNGISSPSFKPGDVVGYHGHVWMILGKCSDGSYVIMHSSPQGVKLAGTVHPTTGSSDSRAITLARYYMRKYFSSYTNKLPNDGFVAGNSYLRGSKLYRFRWDVSGSGVMTDPDGYGNKDAHEILKDILGN